ncbi:TPA: hypothetical protein ACGF4W_001743 [Vibrio cholerae]
MSRRSILIIEDEDPKRRHIEEHIKSHLDDVSLDVIFLHSVSSSLDYLDNNEPELIILDMSLPTYDISDIEGGGRPQGFGGVEILRHLKMSGSSCPTLVLTGYEAFMREEGLVELSQISDELKGEFGTFLIDVLYYNSAYSEWKNRISVTLKSLGLFNKK